MDSQLIDYQTFLAKELELEEKFIANYSCVTTRLEYKGTSIVGEINFRDLIPPKSSVIKISIKIDHSNISLNDLSNIQYWIFNDYRVFKSQSLDSNYFVNKIIRKMDLDLNYHEIFNSLEFDYGQDFNYKCDDTLNLYLDRSRISIINVLKCPIDVEIVYYNYKQQNHPIKTSSYSAIGDHCIFNSDLIVKNLTSNPAFILIRLDILDLLNIIKYKITINGQIYTYLIEECQSFEIDNCVFHLIPCLSTLSYPFPIKMVPFDQQFNNYSIIEKFFFARAEYQTSNRIKFEIELRYKSNAKIYLHYFEN